MSFTQIILCFVLLSFAVIAAKDASTQTDSRESRSIFQEVKNLPVVDLVRLIAMVFGLLVAMAYGRRTWYMAMVIIHTVIGFLDFFFPEQVLKHFAQTEIDVVHIYSVQVIGALVLGVALFLYLTRDSRDPSVMTAVLFSHSVGGVLTAFIVYMDYNKWTNRFAPQMITLGFFPHILGAFGCLFYTFKGSSFAYGRFDINSRVCSHIFIDSLILFILSVVYVAYPDIIVKPITLSGFRADGLHYHLIHLMGILVLTQALLLFMSLGFSNQDDQKAALAGRLMMYACIVPCLFLYQWKHQMIDLYSQPLINHLLLFFIIGNLMCGYFEWQWPKFGRN